MGTVFQSILILACPVFALLYMLCSLIKKDRESAHTQKPKNISLAVNLFWVSIAMGLITALVKQSGHIVVHPPKPLSPSMEIARIVMIAESYVFVGALLAILNLKISAGRNWARIAFLSVYLCQNITAIIFLQSLGLALLKGSAVDEILCIVQSALGAYVLFLIFTKPGSEWFRKNKD